MNNQQTANIEQKAAEWLKSKGYDRRTWKQIAPIIAEYMNERKNESLSSVAINVSLLDKFTKENKESLRLIKSMQQDDVTEAQIKCLQIMIHQLEQIGSVR